MVLFLIIDTWQAAAREWKRVAYSSSTGDLIVLIILNSTGANTCFIEKMSNFAARILVLYETIISF